MTENRLADVAEHDSWQPKKQANGESVVAKPRFTILHLCGWMVFSATLLTATGTRFESDSNPAPQVQSYYRIMFVHQVLTILADGLILVAALHCMGLLVSHCRYGSTSGIEQPTQELQHLETNLQGRNGKQGIGTYRGRFMPRAGHWLLALLGGYRFAYWFGQSLFVQQVSSGQTDTLWATGSLYLLICSALTLALSLWLAAWMVSANLPWRLLMVSLAATALLDARRLASLLGLWAADWTGRETILDLGSDAIQLLLWGAVGIANRNPGFEDWLERLAYWYVAWLLIVRVSWICWTFT